DGDISPPAPARGAEVGPGRLGLLGGGGPRAPPALLPTAPPGLERARRRAPPADGDDGHVLVGLEPRVLEQRSEREIRAAARPRHAELRALEVLHILGRAVLPDYDVEGIPVLQREQALCAETLFREDQRTLGHGAAGVDRAAHHRR